jgi:hypothetical protein
VLIMLLNCSPRRVVNWDHPAGIVSSNLHHCNTDLLWRERERNTCIRSGNGVQSDQEIVAGIDSGGNTLDPEMPRWIGLTVYDLDDVMGYPKTLGRPSEGAPVG